MLLTTNMSQANDKQNKQNIYRTLLIKQLVK